MRFRKRILLALLLLVILPVLVDNIVLFWFMRNRELEQKQEFIERQARQLASTVDLMVGKIQSDFIILSYREPFKSLPEWNRRANYRDKIRLFADFDPVSILSAYYDKAYLLYPDDDLMVDLKNKFITRLSTSSPGRHALKLVAREQGPSKQYEGPSSQDLSRNAAGGIYLVHVLPASATNKVYYLYIELSESFLTDLVGKIFLIDKSALVILDQHGRLLTQESRGTSFDPRDNRNSHLTSSIISPRWGWQYRYALDQSSLEAEILQNTVKYTLVAVLLLMAAIFASTRLARFLTRPISEILELMGLGTGRADNTDEITDIKGNIRLLMERNAALAKAASNGGVLERDLILRNLLHGTAESLPSQAQLDQADIALCIRSGRFYLVGSGLHRSPGPPDLPTVLPPGISLVSLGLEQRRFAIIMSMGDSDLQTAREVLLKYCEASSTSFIGLGSPVNSLSGLADAFRQAQIALDHRGMMTGGGLIDYSEALQHHDGYFYPYETEARLVSLIKQLDIMAVQEQYESFVATVRLSGVSFTASGHVYHHLLDSLVRIIKDFDLPWDSFNLSGPGSIWKLLDNATSVREMEVLMEGFTTTLLERLGSSKDSPTVILANAVKTRVDLCFGNPLLSLDMLSEGLHYSVSHLSTVFKDTFGETIKDYITGMRLGKAQELLANTDELISAIGTRVGYQNFGSFVKIFKTYLGETPKSYRLRMRKK